MTRAVFIVDRNSELHVVVIIVSYTHFLKRGFLNLELVETDGNIILFDLLRERISDR